MDAKTLKMISFAISSVGMVLNLVGGIIANKQQQSAIEEAVKEAVKKQR